MAQSADISGHWAETKVTKFQDKGLIKGYPDGTFKPNNSITRAEFITIVNKVYGFTSTASISYSDVQSSAWFYDEIAKAKAAGYISGYSDGTMKPNNTISRQEVAAILAKLKQFDSIGSDSSLDRFTDKAAIPGWSKGAIGAVVDNSLMTGYPDGSFKPGKPITRAEAVVTLDNAFAAIIDGIPGGSTGGGSTGGSSGGSSGGGGGGGGNPVTLPSEVASVTTVKDPLGDTLVKVTIKNDYINAVKIVKVKGINATQVSGNAGEWRVTLDGSASVGNDEIKVASVYTVTDPLGDKLVKVIPGWKATTVKVNGQFATKVNDYEWRITLNANENVNTVSAE